VIHYSDKALLDGIQKQDRVVLEYIYESYYPPIQSLITRNSGSEDDAKDIFQETILIVYDKTNTDELTLQCSLKTYFYSVSKNLLFEHLRQKRKMNTAFVDTEDLFYSVSKNLLFEHLRQKRKMNTAFVDTEDLESIEVEMDESMHQNLEDFLYYKHFSKLTENCQKIIRMLLRKISSKEITQMMGFTSENYTNKRKHQCKESLMKKIKNDPMYKNTYEDESKLR